MTGHGRHRTARRGAAAIATAAVLAAPASGEISPVVPGVTYERLTRPGQVIHVTRVVPGPLISIRPVLTAGAPTRRGRLTDAMRARLGDGAVAGVNGDYFNLANGYPSGVLLTRGTLVSEPEPARSALVFPPSGALTAARLTLIGSWQASDPLVPDGFPQQPVSGLNRPPEQANETIVFTSDYGELTPTGNRVDALIDLDAPAQVGVDQPVTGTVQSIGEGGGSGVAPGKLVISGAGTGAAAILSDLGAVPGRRVSLTLGLDGLTPGAQHAIGGGPTLVQDGVPIAAVAEGFSSSQIASRTSRTAIGQAADSTILLVAVEGPAQGSRGVTMVEQARLLAQLGAQTAVGMDGGGSSMMAIRDRLVTPWRSERAISDAVVVAYGGVQLTQPQGFLSPNGDGVADRTQTTARAARNGTVRITLARANGTTVKTLYRGPLGPGGRRLTVAPASLRVSDGRYRVVARFTPGDGSAQTNHSHSVLVDRTLGHLRLRKVGPAPATRLRIGFRLAKPARVTITVHDARGKSVKLIVRGRRMGAGSHALTWDMRRAGKPLAPGLYRVGVRVRGPLGESRLTGGLRVPKPPPS
jgi:hypothetical protein